MTTLNIPSGYSWEDFELCRIPEHLHESAMICIAEGNVEGFLSLTSSPDRMDFLIENEDLLLDRGLYERGLLFAFTSVAMDNRHFPLHHTRRLFRMAKRERLLAAGDPLPGRGPFTIYRGVSGRGSKRWIRGMSWTASYEKAQWFATRFCAALDPAVYKLVVPERKVLAYFNRRNEQEFIVMADDLNPVRVTNSAPVQE